MISKPSQRILNAAIVFGSTVIWTVGSFFCISLNFIFGQRGSDLDLMLKDTWQLARYRMALGLIGGFVVGVAVAWYLQKLRSRAQARPPQNR